MSKYHCDECEDFYCEKKMCSTFFRPQNTCGQKNLDKFPIFFLISLLKSLPHPLYGLDLIKILFFQNTSLAHFFPAYPSCLEFVFTKRNLSAASTKSDLIFCSYCVWGEKVEFDRTLAGFMAPYYIHCIWLTYYFPRLYKIAPHVSMPKL